MYAKVFRGEWGHKPAVWPCSPGHSGTDARLDGCIANPNVPRFPKRRGNQRIGMKQDGRQFGAYGGSYRITENVGAYGGGHRITKNQEPKMVLTASNSKYGLAESVLEIKIDGNKTSALLDTGAGDCFIAEGLVRKLNLNWDKKRDTGLLLANYKQVKSLGSVTAKIELKSYPGRVHK